MDGWRWCLRGLHSLVGDDGFSQKESSLFWLTGLCRPAGDDRCTLYLFVFISIISASHVSFFFLLFLFKVLAVVK